MPTVTFIEHNGTTHQVDADVGRTLMQIAVDNSIPGILGDCGGSCSCATCHGYIDPHWEEKLPPVSETESFMLQAVLERHEESRLCCQIKLSPELDGIVVRLPADQA